MSASPLVLVADDDEDIRDTVALVLEDAGYGGAVARDGAEALDRLLAAMLERDPARRLADGQAVLDALAAMG